MMTSINKRFTGNLELYYKHLSNPRVFFFNEMVKLDRWFSVVGAQKVGG